MTAEVVERLRKRYQCSTCSRSWSSRKRCEEHVTKCAADPAARACKTCKHDYLDHDGFVCDVGVEKPVGVTLVFDCPSWEGGKW